MSTKLTETQELIGLKPIVCPHTGKRIIAQSLARFAIPAGQVNWFHCEACRGWHALIDHFTPVIPDTSAK